MSSLSSISDYRAYHILSYGTFLGATFFQSFVSGIVAFRTLPRVQFGRLQSATVPVFFSIQTILPLVMALTYPGNKLAQVAGESLRANSGISGVLAEENRYTVLLPIALLLVTSAANLFILGPATTKTMKERHHQETRDGKKSHDEGPHSTEMQRLNKQFSMLHGASSLSDLVGFIAAIYYGFVLAERL